jgi:ADP-ribosyl-[dinitrogen reductase] hydrolase
MPDEPSVDRALGCLLGLAVGDALGTTLEFTERDENPPLTDMVGGGPCGLKPGEWTDDTSLALCLADSLIACGGLDQRDLMERFVRWWRDGENSPVGYCVDIGITTREALQRFRRTGNPIAGSIGPKTAGNGSIMRLAPVILRWHEQPDQAIAAARRQSVTTHRHPAAVEGCALLAEILVDAIASGDKLTTLRPRQNSEPAIATVAQGSWHAKDRDAISSTGTSRTRSKRPYGASTRRTITRKPCSWPPISPTMPTPSPRSRDKSRERCGAAAAFRRDGSTVSLGEK